MPRKSPMPNLTALIALRDRIPPEQQAVFDQAVGAIKAMSPGEAEARAKVAVQMFDAISKGATASAPPTSVGGKTKKAGKKPGMSEAQRQLEISKLVADQTAEIQAEAKKPVVKPEPGLAGPSLDTSGVNSATNETTTTSLGDTVAGGKDPAELVAAADAESAARSGLLKTVQENDEKVFAALKARLGGSNKELQASLAALAKGRGTGTLAQNLPTIISRLEGQDPMAFGGAPAKKAIVESFKNLQLEYQKVVKGEAKTVSTKVLDALPTWEAKNPRNGSRVVLGSMLDAFSADPDWKAVLSKAKKPGEVSADPSKVELTEAGKAAAAIRKMSDTGKFEPAPTKPRLAPVKPPVEVEPDVDDADFTEEMAEGETAGKKAATAAGKKTITAEEEKALVSKFSKSRKFLNEVKTGVRTPAKTMIGKGANLLKDFTIGGPEQEMALRNLMRNKGGLGTLGELAKSPLALIAAMMLPQVYGNLFQQGRQSEQIEASVPTLAERAVNQRMQESAVRNAMQQYTQGDPNRQMLLMAELRKLDEAERSPAGVPGRHTFGGVSSSEDILAGG